MSGERVVVIGSGPSGAVAAARLVARGVDVTMLDAGPRAPRGWVVRAAGNTVFRRVDRSLLETERHKADGQHETVWQSSRSHGGLSNYWTGAVPRFAPQDFTEGGALDVRYVWPITYDDLAPFYDEVESMIVVTAGNKQFANVPASNVRFRSDPPPDWTELIARAGPMGEFVGSMPMAKGSPWMLARRPTEFSSYHCIVEALEASPHFRLVSSAQATHLSYDSARGRVTTVRYVDRTNGTVVSMPCSAVVVAAGVVDSTMLLLRSKSSDFPSGLGNSNDLVGRYLHDHPREWWMAFPDSDMRALAHPIYVSRGLYDPSEPLMAASLTLGLATRSARLRTYVRGRVGSLGVQVFGTMVPRPERGICIAPGVTDDDVDCRPMIDHSYDQATLDNIARSRQRLKDVFAAGGRRLEIPGPFHDLVPGSSVHYGGSIRMHASPEFGVLDAWNRMYDVPNVVVCDASCFTTGPEKNPTVTVMAIAARAADRLASDLVSDRGAAA